MAAKQIFPKLTGRLATPGFDGFYGSSVGWADAGLACGRLCLDVLLREFLSSLAPATRWKSSKSIQMGPLLSSGQNLDLLKVTNSLLPLVPGLIPAWNSMLAAGQVVGYLPLTPEEVAVLRDIPV